VADRRLIAQSITDSGQVARLIKRCGPWAGLLFSWAIPFTDDDGRTDGDPDTLRSMVLGRFVTQVSEEDVAEYIATMNDLDLVIWYEVIDSGERYMYFPGFGRQQGLRADRYAPSRRPAPPSWVPDESHPYAKSPDMRKTKPQRDGRRTRRVPKRKNQDPEKTAPSETLPPDSDAEVTTAPRQPDNQMTTAPRPMVADVAQYGNRTAPEPSFVSNVSDLSDPSLVSLAGDAGPAPGDDEPEIPPAKTARSSSQVRREGLRQVGAAAARIVATVGAVR